MSIHRRYIRTPAGGCSSRTVVARAYPRIIGQQREKIVDVLRHLPAAARAVGLRVRLSRHRARRRRSSASCILGGAMTAFWLNVLWAMANQLFWEKETGNLALYIMAPNSLMAILLGMAIGGMFATTLRAAGASCGRAPGSSTCTSRSSSYPCSLAVFVLTLTALYGMGMMFASVFLLLGREAWHLIGLAQEPVYLLSGMYFPIKSLNVWVATGGLAHSADARARRHAAARRSPPGTAIGFLSVRTECALLAVLSVVFLRLRA